MWYEKYVLRKGGKFLHCQQTAEVGFHKLFRNLALLPFIFINLSSARIIKPSLAEVHMTVKHTADFKRA